MWLRKRDRSSDTEGGDGKRITTRVTKEGERRCRKERRRIWVGASGLAVACWQETSLQQECGMFNIYSFRVFREVALTSHRKTFTHNLALNLQCIKIAVINLDITSAFGSVHTLFIIYPDDWRIPLSCSDNHIYKFKAVCKEPNCTSEMHHRLCASKKKKGLLLSQALY